MSAKSIISTLICIVVAFTHPAVEATATVTNTNRPSMQDIYVAEWADRDGLEEGYERFIGFLSLTEKKSEVPINWEEFNFQYIGNGDFIVTSRLWDEREYEYKKPRTTMRDRDYLINVLANVFGNVESSTAPDIVQVMGMYTALIRFHEDKDEGTFMEMYYSGDNYDYSSFDPEKPITQRAKKNAEEVVDDYLTSNKDGSYSMNAPYQLYCQSQNFWGRLILFWYNSERDEHEYFSDAGRGDGVCVSNMD